MEKIMQSESVLRCGLCNKPFDRPQEIDNLHNETLDTAPAMPVSDSYEDTFDVPGLGGGVDDFININWPDPNLDAVNFGEFDFLDPVPNLQASKTTEYHYLPTPTPHISLSIPALPRLITRRPSESPGKKRTASLILHTLKSYLLMLMRDNNSLPPFIHPSPIRDQDSNDTVYDPLGTCLTLLKSFNNISKDKSRKGFWNNVRSECERMMSWSDESHQDTQALSSARWSLLSAMQALSIYVVVRLDEGETEGNNVDFLLLGAVTWLFEESRRRLAVIYQILKMLIYFEPAAKCDLPADLLLAPLPANKLLWEASSEESWKARAQGEPEVHRTAFGLATNGELVKLNSSKGRGEMGHRDTMLSHMALDTMTVSRSATGWEEWCSGMDGLGGLIMLVASLVA
ncbi:uncharacterized protein BDV14DRAFT_212080 [Aspergillus stella-maris]|uniref:uncharacterized protein n=1 Tax=Aspergillus stella-maris TaxID=1810926 RepID=UPI003CCE4FFD